MRRRTVHLILITVACGALLGFEDPNPAAREKDADAKPGEVLNIGGVDGPGGTIKGIVKFSGDQKPRKKHRNLDSDPHCANAHKDSPLLKETYIFGKNDTLQNVFVYVSKGLEGKTFAAPSTKVVIDQQGCSYIPHVRGVMVKQPLEILNSDTTTHNVKLISKKNGRENKSRSTKGVVMTKTFKKAEMGVKFQCDVHNWMGAYVHVMGHPFYALTQADGTFEIRGLPAGKYEIATWHELKAFKPDKPSASVTVADGEKAEVTFTYSPPKKKK